MKKKELICNECQACDYSVKEYICIRGKFALVKTSFCMNLDLTPKERKKRIKDKVQCEHFKPAKTGREERLSKAKEALDEIRDQLNVIAQLFAEVDE